MTNNYVGPGWYWVENVERPLFVSKDANTGDLWATHTGVRFNLGQTAINISHIPRHAQRPVVDWSVMPAWAKWVAMDEDGNWHYFEKKPEIGGYNIGGKEWVGDYHNFPREYWPKYSGDWRNSLVERPE